MKIIVNKDIPKEATDCLRQYGDVITLSSSGITYPEISGHPDIFMCEVDDKLIIAPNTPSKFKDKLVSENITIIEGTSLVGRSYPKTANYNAVVTDKYLIHNLDVTDTTIRKLCAGKKAIHVKQAYTRCNLLPLNNDGFITSDSGIHSTLVKNNLDALFVDPKQILLPGFSSGFFGGACGVISNQIFIIGGLSNLMDGNKVKDFLQNRYYEIVELYSGPLFDGGSIIIM